MALNYFMKSSILLLLIMMLTACGGDSQKQEKAERGRQLDLTDEVTFLRSNGSEISTIRVALADDAAERNQGLMDVSDLPRDAGMLFVFPDEEERSFYMANTPLPLDIIFVNADSTIVRIHHNTSPFSDSQLRSEEPAQYVVETNGGYCVANDIQEGMRVRF